MFNNPFLKFVSYEIMCENVVKPDSGSIVWRVRIACWITKARVYTLTQRV